MVKILEVMIKKHDSILFQVYLQNGVINTNFMIET